MFHAGLGRLGRRFGRLVVGGGIEVRVAERTRIAREILAFRRKAAGSGLDRRTVNELARTVAGADLAPPKPTLANLWAEARDAWRFGSEPIRAHGNEYYSQCGLDDAEGECKRGAREHALSIWREIGRPLP